MKKNLINDGVDLQIGQRYVALLLQCENQNDLNAGLKELEATHANVKVIQFDSFETTHWVWLLSAPFDNQDPVQMQVALSLLTTLNHSKYLHPLASNLFILAKALGDTLDKLLPDDTFDLNRGSDTTCDYVSLPNSVHPNQMISVDASLCGLVFDCISVKITYHLLGAYLETLYLHHDNLDFEVDPESLG